MIIINRFVIIWGWIYDLNLNDKENNMINTIIIKIEHRLWIVYKVYIN